MTNPVLIKPGNASEFQHQPSIYGRITLALAVMPPAIPEFLHMRNPL